MAGFKMVDKKNIVVSGKRKTSIARGYITEGTGVVRINKININNYGSEISREKIKEPLIIAGDSIAKKVNITVTVKGGGSESQADAARIVVAKLLIEHTGSKELKEKYFNYDKHMLVADTRRTEPQKPYRSSARSMRQTSKR
ncbi:MAG: 30S ribosomal protein S9 [Candidatus Nanoarchaeia archaeon]|nr:30S ribosomal protein S9 [Candidatus Nanoarchaeia archaeon]